MTQYPEYACKLRNSVIVLRFSGNYVPTEGEVYYFVTKDDAVIRKTHEVLYK